MKKEEKEIQVDEQLLKKVKSRFVAKAVGKLLKLDKAKATYESAAELRGSDFVNAVLAKLDVQYQINPDDLKNIPRSGPFILVSNHPYGGIDGLVLLSILLQHRPEFRMMGNYLLQGVKALDEHLVFVDPDDRGRNKEMNVKAIKKSLSLLKNEVPVGIFPAGEVSAFNMKKLNVSDKMWHPVVGKMIVKAGVKVVPVYFPGHNSVLFNLLGLVNPEIRTAKLPSELFNKRNALRVRIGKAVSAETIAEFDDSDQVLRFLRAKTYSLGTSLEVKQYFRTNGNPKQPSREIISTTPQELLQEDIERIRLHQDLLFKYQEFEIYLSSAFDIPNILREITRLREITFREVGEGTYKDCDTDEFDLHYKHLFVWDGKAGKIVGAYRLGEGNKLMARFKKKGFYLNELFRFDKNFTPVFRTSLELGRSFIIKEYQRNPAILKLLWKGINLVLKRNEDKYKYLIGPVSISNKFTGLSKHLLVDYILKHHFDEKLARHVKPRKQYKYKHYGEGTLLKESKIKDLNLLDQIISDVEPDRTRIPVLLKKYLARNARIIAFNVDPRFSHSLDGLLVMKLEDIPPDSLGMLK